MTEGLSLREYGILRNRELTLSTPMIIDQKEKEKEFRGGFEVERPKLRENHQMGGLFHLRDLIDRK